MTGYCEICGEDTEVHDVDGMDLCDDCDSDYFKINRPDPKLFKFYWTIGKNNLEQNPKWFHHFKLLFCGDVLLNIKFKWKYDLLDIIKPSRWFK